jgi:glycosyltransferase involved in cell wall biosynthesis
MDQLAAMYSKLRILHITELPENWLGKVHAMHSGAELASGEFLLFTDGDVIYQPDALEQALRYTVQQSINHLCLVPRFISGDLLENALVNFFGMVFLMTTRPQSVNSSSSQLYAGVGAFNLVAKTAYQQVGGYQALRLEIVDDMRLGQLLKQQGFKTHLLLADDLLSLKWYSGVKAVIKGLEKNCFAALDFSWVKLLLFTVVFKLLVFYPYLLLFWLWPSVDCIGFALTLLVMHGAYAYSCNKFHPGDWKITWALPIAAFFTLIAVWNSALMTFWQGGVKWRDTFYPLALLKSYKT